MISRILFCISLIFLAACSPIQPPVVPTATVAYATLESSPTATERILPVATLTPVVPTITPTPRPTISVENAVNLTQFSQLGKGTARNVMYLKDNRALVVVGGTGIFLYDTATLTETKFIKTSVFTFGSSSDGQTFVTNSANSIQVWDGITGQLLHTLEAVISAYGVLAVSPDAQMVATGINHEVKIWDTSSSKLLHTLKDDNYFDVERLVFSPDGHTLATTTSGDSDHSSIIKFWDPYTGELQRIFKGAAGEFWVDHITFNPNGSKYVLWDSNTVELWDAKIGDSKILGHNPEVNDMAFSPDGNILAFATNFKTIQLWSVVTGKLLRTFTPTSQPADSIAFSPDGNTLASAGIKDTAVRIWDVNTGQQVNVIEGFSPLVTSVAFSPDSRMLASGNRDGIVRLWDPISGQLLHTLEGHVQSVSSVAFSPDGQFLASGGEEGRIQLWNSTSSELVRTLSQAAYNLNEAVAGIAFSPDGRKLSAITSARIIRQIDVTTGQELLRFGGKHNQFCSGTRIVYSPDGHQIAASPGTNCEPNILIYDGESGKLLRSLTGHSGVIAGFAFSEDGHILVSTGTDKTVRVWNPNTGNLLRSFAVSSGDGDIAFSPDGKLLAKYNKYYTLNGAVELWDFNAGRLLSTIEQRPDGKSLAFSPDGRILAIGSFSGSITLWAIEIP
jgi:WD40 repeat protein